MSTIIILVCILVWGLQTLLLTQNFEGYYWLIYHLGANPQQTLTLQGFGGLTAITATFLHGGFAHLLFNMWALRVFGRRVEDACGSWRFLAFYLFCGATCNIAFTVINAGSDLPAIGASGAVYGVMAAYLFLYPGGRIRMLILTPYPFWPRVRAFWVVLFFFVTAMLSGLDVLVNQADYRTAHWGHLGGFFGAVTILFFLRPEAFRRYINHLPV